MIWGMGNRKYLPVVLESESAILAVFIWVWNTSHCSKHGFTALSRWMRNSRKTFLWKEPGRKLLLFKLTFICELSGSIQKFWSKVQYEHQYPAIARWAVTGGHQEGKKETYFKQCLKLKQFFLQFVIGYLLYDTLCIVRVDQKEPDLHNLKWNDRHRLGQITSFLYTETITVVDTLHRKKPVWILHFKLACPENMNTLEG